MELKQGTICYIAGPISGIEDLNRKEFYRVQDDLEIKGLVGMNPFDITEGHEELDFLLKSKESIINPAEKQSIDKRIWNYCMKKDIMVLVQCQAVIVLKGWETSQGANLELYIASKLEIPIYKADTFEKLEYDRKF